MTRSPEFEPEINEAISEAEATRREAPKAEEEDTNNIYRRETEQAKDIEMRTGDLQQQKQSSTAVIANDKGGKTLGAYHAVSKKLALLIEEYTKLLEKDLHQAQRLLEDVHQAQEIQEKLYKKIIGKLDEKIEEEKLVKEVESL